MVKIIFGALVGAVLLFGYQQNWHEDLEWESYPVKIEFEVPIPIFNDEKSIL